MAIISPEIGAFYLGNTFPEFTDGANNSILEGTTWSSDGVGTDFAAAESEFQYQGQQLVANPNFPVNVWDDDSEGFKGFDSWVQHNQADGTPGEQLNVIGTNAATVIFNTTGGTTSLVRMWIVQLEDGTTFMVPDHPSTGGPQDYMNAVNGGPISNHEITSFEIVEVDTQTNNFTPPLESFLGQGLTDPAPVNEDPDAVDDVYDVDEDGSITSNPLENDTDPNGDPLEITSITQPANGTAVLNDDGTVTYTPDPDFNGTDTITYEVSDGNGGTTTATVTYNVAPVGDAPVVVDDVATTDEDTPVTIDVLDNDSDPDGQPLTIGEATVPAEQGTVEIVNGELVFTPAPDFNGDATISYTAVDPDGNETPGEITVNVAPINDAPDAINDAITTDEDTPVTIDALDNDVDVDGDDLTITAASVPADQGTVEIIDNELVFTPAEDFNGEATISYSIEDGNGGTDTAEVAVTVEPVNDDPVAVDDIVTTDEDTPITFNPAANDTDVDEDPLTVTSVGPIDPALGTVELVDGEVVFTPAPNFNGPVEIHYTVDDGNGGTDEGVANVNVSSVIDPPEAVDDTATTDEDTPVTIDVLDNDSDPEGQPLTITAATVPADQGTVEIVGNELVFTPAENFNGDATITYAIQDPDGATDTAEVAVTVNPVNDDPVAVDDIENTDEDTPITFNPAANDTDVDGDPLVVSSVGPIDPALGTVELVDGEVVFTPAPDFNGPVEIPYTVSDGNGGEAPGTALVNVGPVNDAPDAVDDNQNTAEDTPVVLDLLGNDTDPDGDVLSVISATVDPAQGTVELVDGVATFTPAPDFNGEAEITYTISDGNGLTDTATHTVNVTPVGDPDGVVDGEDTGETMGVGYNDEDGPTDGGGDL
ncbi:Ig-like domain-containing protein, partial [Marivivens donghaensis]|uniref:Ig-like domain-containing protein n=1 Tax=Marivivens donghaensis TaxID=1699413 RepID=UPI003F69B443